LQKLWFWVSYILGALEINNYIVYNLTYTLYTCPIEIQMYPTGGNCQSHNPRKYTVFNRNYVLDVGDILRDITEA
jgi:hypothetical protein